MALFQKAVHPYGQNLLPSISPSVFKKHRWFDAPKQGCLERWRMTLIVSPNGLYFHASKCFLQVGVIYFFIFPKWRISQMLERNAYLISKYSRNLQYFTLICMYLTPGLTEFILIRIHSLPTKTGYNWYNAMCYSSAAHFHHHVAFPLSQQTYTQHWPSLCGLDMHYTSNYSS